MSAGLDVTDQHKQYMNLKQMQHFTFHIYLQIKILFPSITAPSSFRLCLKLRQIAWRMTIKNLFTHAPPHILNLITFIRALVACLRQRSAQRRISTSVSNHSLPLDHFLPDLSAACSSWCNAPQTNLWGLHRTSVFILRLDYTLQGNWQANGCTRFHLEASE